MADVFNETHNLLNNIWILIYNRHLMKNDETFETIYEFTFYEHTFFVSLYYRVKGIGLINIAYILIYVIQ